MTLLRFTRGSLEFGSALVKSVGPALKIINALIESKGMPNFVALYEIIQKNERKSHLIFTHEKQAACRI